MVIKEIIYFVTKLIICNIDIVFSEKLTPIYFIYFTSEFIDIITVLLYCDIIFGEDSSEWPTLIAWMLHIMQ